MDQFGKSATSWQEGVSEGVESTVAPGISVSMISDDVPKLTVAAIVGVTLVVIVAIVVVFGLGVLIDCRQQRILKQKIEGGRRPKNRRKVSTHPEGDVATIVSNMEEPESSLPPAEILRNIP